MRAKKIAKPTRYFDSNRWLKSLEPKPLKTTKSRTARTFSQIQTTIEDNLEKLGHPPNCIAQHGKEYNGGIIKATDGHILLATRHHQKVIPGSGNESKLIVPTENTITIANPKFYLILKRAAVVSDFITLNITPEEGIMTCTSINEESNIEYIESLEIYKTSLAKWDHITLNIKLLLDSVGIWPLKLTWNTPTKPILFTFPDYQIVIMPVRPTD